MREKLLPTLQAQEERPQDNDSNTNNGSEELIHCVEELLLRAQLLELYQALSNKLAQDPNAQKKTKYPLHYRQNNRPDQYTREIPQGHGFSWSAYITYSFSDPEHGEKFVSAQQTQLTYDDYKQPLETHHQRITLKDNGSFELIDTTINKTHTPRIFRIDPDVPIEDLANAREAVRKARTLAAPYLQERPSEQT